MKVVWGEDAKRDLREAIAFIKRENPVAARRVAHRIRLAAQELEDFPEKYRRGFALNTREQVVHGLPYIMVYRVEQDRVIVVALFHASTNRPRGG